MCVCVCEYVCVCVCVCVCVFCVQHTNSHKTHTHIHTPEEPTMAAVVSGGTFKQNNFNTCNTKRILKSQCPSTFTTQSHYIKGAFENVHIYVYIYHTKSLHIKGTFENVYIYIRP
jgi:hypothetical protein